MSNVCQNCKKARATVHLTEIDPENNRPHEMHLCEECARESGSAPTSPAKSIAITASLIGAPPGTKGGKGGRGRAAAGITCPGCGMTLQEFRVKGRFGCARCYDIFEEGLVPLLERIHGATQYVGHHPRGSDPSSRSVASLTQELLDLRRRMSRLVKNEEYEEAARLRDRIEEVEQHLAEAGDG